ncbi:PQQ-binding-like beta-propeller repeat protein [Pyxidicoccus fallax]|uniref:PQQ-binding-like beta-propeller repeat protein n=2 Tax=Pyxidicoccus fallax TaxID=394095 RepID=A0A848M059_9BACT|nr:PQQ-binding-like beta-propeller repeat protein [Pyxidicoccus fallax]NMO23230.1 PQQ-binding-like beta-propeller repeat protein [Pyxidicoccus fallax]NPC86211.1 PQQ-binding-like beta-propeller repeat protein [Pyxidicoccus fallax]
MNPFNARLAVLLAFLVPVVAGAQSTTRAWLINTIPQPGEAQATVVMDEASELTVEVRNNTRLTSPQYQTITDITFTLPTGYVPLRSSAPPEWAVDYVVAGRQITFSRTVNCQGTADGLDTGEVATFVLRMIPLASAADRNIEQFATGTVARNQCTGQTFATTLNAAVAQWKRVGLSSSFAMRPRVLGVNGQTSARIVVENRSTAAQTGITATAPTTSPGGVSFTVLGTEPTPFQVDLTTRTAGVFAVRAQATTTGASVAQIRGTNAAGTVTSPLTGAAMVNVGPLAAAVDLDTLEAFSSDTVRVRMTVTNTSTTDTFTNVRPQTLEGQGSATLTSLSGPTPASVSRLGPGASAHFIWTYRVTGAAGANYGFRARADATRGGTALTGDLVESPRGRLVEHRVRVSPEVVAVGTTNQRLVYTVQNRGPRPILEVRLLRPTANYFAQPASPVSPTGWTVIRNDATGITWQADATGIPPGGELSFSALYASFGAVTGPTTFRHRFHVVDDYDGPPMRLDAPVTILAGTAPDAERLTAVARDASVTLTWDNPVQHNGVLVLRAEGANPNTAPVQGRAYAVGETVGNARVVYADEFSPVSTFTDTTVTNGVTYRYRVYNMDDLRWYSAGNQPTASTALIATPRARLSGEPLWCYSVGLDARLQPITEAGVGIFSSFNSSVVANLTQVSNPSQDGAERWRPLPLSGLIGSRFPVVPLRGLPGQYILVGDQGGVAYAISASSGEVLWRWDNGGNPIGTIQSFPVTQLHDFANAAYQAAHPGRDLVFFATRLANPAQNRVVALNAATGALVWTYQPGDLGMISGGMVVDYANNRLFLGTRSHAGSQDTLRVLNTLATGPAAQEVARLPVGDVDLSLVRNAVTNLILASANDGTVHAVNATTLQPAWSIPVATPPAPNTPAFTSFVRPQGAGFLASLASGQVQFWDTTSASITPTLKWSTPIADPSGAFSFNRGGVARVYVGSSDGQVHQLELIGGTDSGRVSMGGAQLIGTPTIDTPTSRLHVGSQDGRICAFAVPFL